MRFRRRPEERDAPTAVEEPEPAAAQPAVAEEPPAPPLELTHAELTRLVEEAAVANPARAAEWRWYADYLRERVDADGRIPAEYRLLLRIVYSELPGLPELGPGQTATTESTAPRSDET